MNSTTFSLLVFVSQAIVWFLVSTNVPYAYMDEIFHVGQYLSFNRWLCRGEQFVWDNSITTFPGLYLVSLIPGLPLTCDLDTPSGHVVSVLRGINAFIIFPAIFLVIYRMSGKSTITALLVCFMPFNWFYSHLYYTDSFSTLSILVTLMFQKEGKIFKSGIAAIVAVLARQTNIVWVFGFSCLEVLERSKFSSVSSVVVAVRSLWIQVLLGVSFIIFLKWNNWSVVLGHHEHHSMSLHWAQLNYFILLLAGIAWPIVLTRINVPPKMKNLLTQSRIILFIVSVVFAEFGTIVHPFILSDNRHYTFYLYRKFLQYRWIRSLVIPAIVSLVFPPIFRTSNPLSLVSSNAFVSRIVFGSCVVLTMVPTPLIEFRYFNIPATLMLMDFAKQTSPKSQTITIFFATIINIVTMYVFIYRPFESKEWGLGRFMY